MYTVLSVTHDSRLALARNDTLALHGYRVVAPRVPDDAPDLAEQMGVDAAVIGHLVEQREVLIRSIRARRPGCLIVFVYIAPTAEAEPAADLSVDVTAGFEPLIRVLEEHFGRTGSTPQP